MATSMKLRQFVLLLIVLTLLVVSSEAIQVPEFSTLSKKINRKLGLRELINNVRNGGEWHQKRSMLGGSSSRRDSSHAKCGLLLFKFHFQKSPFRKPKSWIGSYCWVDVKWSLGYIDARDVHLTKYHAISPQPQPISHLKLDINQLDDSLPPHVAHKSRHQIYEAFDRFSSRAPSNLHIWILRS
ncbi:hypothetical protein D0Y65_034533 [Glycine soja]|uniref:Uncharacterized protein n=1 Tax=Glycine soja TaxID=3848 RepID=A0A445HQX9_GLYSO|nr:hypothetical protein D0Y65_034533 [Glycine soja]